MARVQGIQEKVHLPIYDSIKVEPGKQLFDIEKSGTLKFFVDVQGKTKLETNLQSASLLPHYNTFEARAMRVVIGDSPAEFPDEETAVEDGPFEITDDLIQPFFVDGSGSRLGILRRSTNNPPKVEDLVAAEPGFAVGAGVRQVFANVSLSLQRLIDLIREARESEDGEALIAPDDEDVTLAVATTFPAGGQTNEQTGAAGEDLAVRLAEFGGSIGVPLGWLEGYLEELSEQEQPLDQQIEPNNGAGTLIGSLIYNTVTGLFVGEKLMMQMPTYFFPAGAGPHSESGGFTTHGEPSPMATFRFAEPVCIDRQQNFRVEIEVPDTDTLKKFQRIYGPFQIWVILDGYMTRDVQ